jgi:hypothetical protein
MPRHVVTASGRRTVATKAATSVLALDNRPLSLQLSRDRKRVIVCMPWEIWIVNEATLEVEKAIELPVKRPAAFEAEDEGVLWIGGTHLHRGNLWSGTATKVGSKLGGFVDRVCMVRPRILCGVGTQGEVLWNVEDESFVHRRKAHEHDVRGLVASPDGRAIWVDGSPHAWVVDPDHASGYMKVKLKQTSAAEVEHEALVSIGVTADGWCLLGARDGAVAWTNRALRIVGERYPAIDHATRSLGGEGEPLALAGNERWIYALRPGAVLHRFLVAQPEREPDAKEEPPPLPEAQMVRLGKPASALAVNAEGKLLLAGPHSDDQLGRLWREDPDALSWEPLRMRARTLVEAVPVEEPDTPKKPDFTPTRSKVAGHPIAEIKVDDVLGTEPAFWITRGMGTMLERPTAVHPPDEVLPGDALLLPAMFRLHGGDARPGLVLWPGAPEGRPVGRVQLLTWGDRPRGWLQLGTPSIRNQGWSRREVFPLEVALRNDPPVVPGRRPVLPKRWNDHELFAALAKECKKLLKVLW